MPYMISSRSVTDGVSLWVRKSKLVYSSLIFVDYKFLVRMVHVRSTSSHYSRSGRVGYSKWWDSVILYLELGDLFKSLCSFAHDCLCQYTCWRSFAHASFDKMMTPRHRFYLQQIIIILDASRCFFLLLPFCRLSLALYYVARSWTSVK